MLAANTAFAFFCLGTWVLSQVLLCCCLINWAFMRLLTASYIQSDVFTSCSNKGKNHQFMMQKALQMGNPRTGHLRYASFIKVLVWNILHNKTWLLNKIWKLDSEDAITLVTPAFNQRRFLWCLIKSKAHLILLWQLSTTQYIYE